MKFGFRIPSLTKRFAARTSLKRVIRHNLGFKAPKGFGWFTAPKKALYNGYFSTGTLIAYIVFVGNSLFFIQMLFYKSKVLLKSHHDYQSLDF